MKEKIDKLKNKLNKELFILQKTSMIFIILFTIFIIISLFINKTIYISLLLILIEFITINIVTYKKKIISYSYNVIINDYKLITDDDYYIDNNRIVRLSDIISKKELLSSKLIIIKLKSNEIIFIIDKKANNF